MNAGVASSTVQDGKRMMSGMGPTPRTCRAPHTHVGAFTYASATAVLGCTAAG